METSELGLYKDKSLVSAIIQNRVYLLLGLSLFIFAVACYVAFFSDKQESILSANTYITPKQGDTALNIITIDVAGAVKKPGVYKLPATSRVEQAIASAGGFDEASVDKDFVARQVNLAAKLSDGQKIYVLHKGEDKSVVPMTILGSVASNDGKINVNTASSAQLESLPGVGASSASKIIANRPYTSIDELVTKKALTKTTLTKIQNSISIQ